MGPGAGVERLRKRIEGHLQAKFGRPGGYPARPWRRPREEAWTLVEEWVQSESLRKHLLGVETGMRAYARRFGEDEELYAVTGLLHDLDYERYPDLETGHPRRRSSCSRSAATRRS